MAIVIGGHLLLAPTPAAAGTVAMMLSLMLVRLAQKAAGARALRTLALVVCHHTDGCMNAAVGSVNVSKRSLMLLNSVPCELRRGRAVRSLEDGQAPARARYRRAPRERAAARSSSQLPRVGRVGIERVDGRGQVMDDDIRSRWASGLGKHSAHWTYW
jgi:hypothetical protein